MYHIESIQDGLTSNTKYKLIDFFTLFRTVYAIKPVSVRL